MADSGASGKGSRRAMSSRAEVERDDLVRYLAAYLAVERVRDACHNGLQVIGRPQVERLVTGVSARRALFRAAAERKADAVLVHHGLFWQRGPNVIGPLLKERLKLLFDHDMSLLAYHLPLDSHPEVGNNALLARALGLAVEPTPFGVHEGSYIGALAATPAPLPVEELAERLRALTGQPPLVFPAGPPSIRRVAIVTGSAAGMLAEAVEVGADAFITGEARESTPAEAEELGCHFLAGGHYATERLGVQALGAHLAERFGLWVEFVDLPHPV